MKIAVGGSVGDVLDVQHEDLSSIPSTHVENWVGQPVLEGRQEYLGACW